MNDLENDCPFWLLLAAKVVRTWRDDDGYGNEDSDYLTMTLKIATWPDNETLMARIRSSKDGAPPILEGKNYAIKGGLYFQVPEKHWHRTNLQIMWHKEIEGPLEEANPRFGIVCKIISVNDDNTIGLFWRSWDNYESADYAQSLTIPCPMATADVKKENKHKLWVLAGEMAGMSDLRATTMRVTLFEVNSMN